MSQHRQEFIFAAVGQVGLCAGRLFLWPKFCSAPSPLQNVDIHQQNGRAVDLIVGGHVGANAERVPPPVVVLDVEFRGGQRIDDFFDQFGQFRQIEVGAQITDSSAHVAGNQIENGL